MKNKLFIKCVAKKKIRNIHYAIAIAKKRQRCSCSGPSVALISRFGAMISVGSAILSQQYI